MSGIFFSFVLGAWFMHMIKSHHPTSVVLRWAHISVPIIAMLFVMAITAITGCVDEQKDVPPIPMHQVIIDGVPHEVVLRHWCAAEKMCELMPMTDTYWAISPDGRIEVMKIDKELHFERGFFANRPGKDPEWVGYELSDYLVADTPEHRALIIHYPLSEEEQIQRTDGKEAGGW